MKTQLIENKPVKKTKKRKDMNHLVSLVSPSRGVKEQLPARSRSTTPQRVFRCPQKTTKSPPINIYRRTTEPPSLSSTRAFKSPGKILKATLPAPAIKLKKKNLVNLESFKVTVKPKEKKDREQSVSKTTIKPKKKKKQPEKQLQESNTTLVRGRQKEFEHLNRLRSKLQAKIEKEDHQKSKSKAISFLNESKSSVMSRSKPSERMTVLDILEAAVIMIQKNVRGYLCRKHIGNFLRSILEEESIAKLSEKHMLTELTPQESQYIPMKPHASDLEPGRSDTSSYPNLSDSLRKKKKNSGTLKKDKAEHSNATSAKFQRLTLGRSGTSWEEGNLRDTQKIRKVDAAVQVQMPEKVVKPPEKRSIQLDCRQEDFQVQKKQPVLTVKNLGQQVVIQREQVRVKKPSMKEIQTQVLLAPSPSRTNLESFAKEQYQKWHQVDTLVHKLNSRFSRMDPQGISNFFRQIEELACKSKYSLKCKYKLSDRSSISLSESYTHQSMMKGLTPNGSGTVGDLLPDSQGNSFSQQIPVNMVRSKKALLDKERWPEQTGADMHNRIDMKNSQVMSSERKETQGLFESMDGNLDKIIGRDSKISKSMKISSRDNPQDLSDSVLRSSVHEKDLMNQVSQKSLNKYASKESITDQLEQPLTANKGFSMSKNLHQKPPLVDEPPSPISTTLMEGVPRLLQKTKSKGSIHSLRRFEPVSDQQGLFQSAVCLEPLLLQPLPATTQTFEACYQKAKVKTPKEPSNTNIVKPSLPSHLLDDSPSTIIIKNKTPTDHEINIVLQTILDDLTPTPSSPVDIEVSDSTRRIPSLHMWDIDTPASTDREKAEFADSLVSELIKGTINDLFKEQVWKEVAHKRGKKLEEKFKEIDELLSYEETSPIAKHADKDIQLPSKPQPPSPQINNKILPDNVLAANQLDELEVSNGEQSEAETVYGIRTNFNAVEEYLKLLLKFLKERLKELSLPASKNKADLILRRVHSIEYELKENKEKEAAVKFIDIPKKVSKKDPKHLKCFKRETEQYSFLPASLFTILEEEILVSLRSPVIVQRHEHHGGPVRHAADLPPSDLRLLFGRTVGGHSVFAAVDRGVSGEQKQAQTGGDGKLAREGNGVRAGLRHDPRRDHPRQGRLDDGQHQVYGT